MFSKMFRKFRGVGCRARGNSHWGKIMKRGFHRHAGYSKAKANRFIHPFL